ncbi:uncharacterized protein LOC143027358 [Oratosquilla oratoria]|uniref:uncharacterized protein LOC143027358 n=1 Tax=Oratosquilla oratoria TaxID=337810 RepID=UPI003F75D51D
MESCHYISYSLKQPSHPPGYINLTNKTLTTDAEDLLNHGLNCHMPSKPPWHAKLVKLESLLDDILHLPGNGKVKLDEGIREELQREARVERNHHKSSLVTRRHLEAAKSFIQDTSITIRRTDKASCYVLIPSDEYTSKINDTISDSSKFQVITRNPVEDLKKRANFLDFLRGSNSEGVITFLDVESLYTTSILTVQSCSS